MKEKQEQENKSSHSPISFTSVHGGKPVKVYPGAAAKKKILYDNEALVAKQTFENIASSTNLSNRDE